MKKARALLHWEFPRCSHLRLSGRKSCVLSRAEDKGRCWVFAGSYPSAIAHLSLFFFAMAMATTVRSAARLLRTKAPSSVQRSSRTFASDAHEHGPKRVPLWEDPMHPGRWKEEHFVFVSLAGWGVLIYGGYKLFAGGSKEKKDTAPAKSSASTPAHH